MDRRTVITTAGAITLTILAGTTAIAANVGILGREQKDPVGELSPVANMETTVAPSTTAAAPEVETVYVDEVVKVGGSGQQVPAGGSVAGTSGAGVAPPPVATAPPAPGATAPYDDYDDDYDDEDRDDRDDDDDDEDDDDDDDDD